MNQTDTARDELFAFRAGYRYGTDHGLASATDAIRVLGNLGYPTLGGSVDAFCNGAEDGARGDSWRYDRTAWICEAGA